MATRQTPWADGRETAPRPQTAGAVHCAKFIAEFNAGPVRRLGSAQRNGLRGDVKPGAAGRRKQLQQRQEYLARAASHFVNGGR